MRKSKRALYEEVINEFGELKAANEQLRADLKELLKAAQHFRYCNLSGESIEFRCKFCAKYRLVVERLDREADG